MFVSYPIALIVLLSVLVSVVVADDLPQLSRLQAEATKMLQEHQGRFESLGSLDEHIQKFANQIVELQRLEESLIQRTANLEDKLRVVNAAQLQDFAEKLNNTYSKEKRRREKASAVAEENSRVEEVQVEDLTQAVKLHEIDNILDGNSIIEDSEQALESWVADLVQKEVAEASKEMQVAAQTNVPGEPEKCLTPMEAAHLVEASLIKHDNDAVGLDDLLKGAGIVYEMTSDSFDTPPEDHDLLGNVWWRRYIPEDVERILPPGWETWNVKVPSTVSRMLGLKGSTLPPEAVLDANVYPGACWPMEGSKGQITFRLQKPIESVAAVTYDHAPRILLEKLGEGSTGPKNFRVVVYPPCDTCDGLGFDVSKGKDLGTFTFDRDGRSKQTFEIESSSGSEPGGCSAVAETPSCSADGAGSFQQPSESADEPLIAAMTFEVLDNYGDDEYTCLYRIRVHGEV